MILVGLCAPAATMAGTLALLGAAGATVGTADTLLAAFFGFDNICRCATNDQQDHSNYDDIYRLHSGSPLSFTIYK